MRYLIALALTGVIVGLDFVCPFSLSETTLTFGTVKQREFMDFKLLSEQSEFGDEAIVDADLSNALFVDKELYNCVIENGNFSGANITGTAFEDCIFRNCNLSNVKVDGSRLVGVRFEGCKVVGINFIHFDQTVYDASFHDCRLMECNFSKMKMKKAVFESCEIIECDFNSTYLVEAVFNESLFKRTLFHDANLQKASFFNASGYSIDPRNNKVAKAVFCFPEVLALIECFDVDIRHI